MRRTSRWLLAGWLAIGAPLTGCASAAGPAQHGGADNAPAPAPVDDASFARTLREVLADGARDEARRAKVLGVVRAQLLHARARFERGAEDRALRSVLGAMYLLRRGEESPGVFDAETAPAIDGAIRRLAARGDEGRSRVLYGWRARTATKAEAAEIQKHVAALDSWAKTRTGLPIEIAGEAQRAALGRAMLDPTAIDDAVRATSDWIDLGIQANVAFRQSGKRPTQEEAAEVARGLGSGGTTVAALLLRYGDVGGAIEKIDSSSARRIIDPDLYAQLVQAQSRDDGESWRALFAALDEQTTGRVGGELGIDAELLDAAFLGVVIEAYRREPSHVATAVELSRSLASFGMSEAVPLVLEPALGGRPSPEQVSAVLRALVGALEADARANDIAGARRTVNASGGLLEAAQKAAGAAKISPSVADVRQRMAGVLIRGGVLDGARPLLVAALAEKPTSEGHLLLAMLERQAGRPNEALEAAKVASASGSDPLDVADAKLVAFEIHRDAGRAAEAQAALTAALETVTPHAQGRGGGPKRVRALRTLGRVLQAFGDASGAKRAFSRALDEMGGDRAVVGTTMLQAASSALVRGDLEGARAALQKGIDAGAPLEDLVYGALWLMLVEKQLRAVPDGTADEILESALASPTWVGKLAAWAKGRLNDDALVAQAFSESTRVEASFYVAMGKRAGGAPTEESLRKVAESPVLDLMEVQIARDILAPRTTYALPKGAKLP
ncbi:MAG: hypothetical protein JNL21_25545 [Myxococcales bacterium]|nr:hypothetical protein [Myxococcales bacterium]